MRLAFLAIAVAPFTAAAQTGGTVTLFPEAPTIDLHGDAARRAFVPVVAAPDSGGECRVNRYPNGTSGLVVYFPSERNKEATLFATFDQAGKIQHFSENRGRPWKVDPPPNATPAQLYDAGMKAFLSVRNTSIVLDFRRDSAMATNTPGDGTPKVRIKGTVQEIENLENLGPPKAPIGPPAHALRILTRGDSRAERRCRIVRAPPEGHTMHAFVARSLAALTLVSATLAAQGTAADYARSDGLRRRLEGTVIGAPQTARWIGTTSSFWYNVSTATGNDIVVFDATTKTKTKPVDLQKLASALPSGARRAFTATTLPVNSLTFTALDTVQLTADSTQFRCALSTYVCTARERQQPRGGLRLGGGLFGTLGTPDERPHVSPDGKWEALVRNFNVFVRPAGATRGNEGTMLSTDGIETDAYSQQTLTWSPDSKKIAAYRVRPGFRREIYYVESSPEDQLQPKRESMLYNKPGDVLDTEQPVLFDVENKKQVIVERSLFPDAYDMTAPEWRKDNRAFVFEYNQRGHQAYRIIEVDAATGKARAQINEEMPTFFEYSAKKYRLDIADGREVIWMSERDGWNHLYLYDGVTGKVKNQITKGAWVVRGVEKVDTIARQIYFSASGMYAGKDPYFQHFYRINFDGTGLVTYTTEDANHSVNFSSDMKYYVDTYSRVDLPPVSDLRVTSNQSLVTVLEKADASKLYAAGWKAPEVFVAKARDGKTDIWGVVIRPTNFDPAKKYPVIENIYAGPQGSFVPKTFSNQLGMQSIAELGFIVVQIDGMGTSNRSKAFHDVAWKNLGDAGFPDRILWHKAVAAKYPSYDISRVGIYGTSAGGQNSMGALLFHPEFYKVAFSAAGCHDNRMDKIWWNEQWMGVLGPHYAASSNMENASKLEGHLMLVVGEMDKNVDPASTFQVVNALIKANKTFDLLVIPGAGHTSGGPYGDRKRNDFFVHHLLGVEPPDRNAKTSAAVSTTSSP